MSNIICGQCAGTIPTEDVNIGEGVALCRACGTVSRVADMVASQVGVPAADPRDVPSGCRVDSDGVSTSYVASARSFGSVATLLFVSLFWNGIVSVFVLIAIASTLQHMGVTLPSWFPAPTSSGQGQPSGGSGMSVGMTIFMWVFLTPFILIGSGMIVGLLTSLFGSVRVRFEGRDAAAFVGIGMVGRTKRFNASSVTSVRLVDSDTKVNDRPVKCIEIEADETVKFGTMLSKRRRQWLAAVVHQHVFGTR